MNSKIEKSKQKYSKGFLLIDKPQGITSYDVVRFVKKLFPEHKVGHAGTLDPLATGVLVLGIGPSTKKLSCFLSQDKHYDASLLLGHTTDTQDITGKTRQLNENFSIEYDKIDTVCKQFLGDIQQIPPMFSAKKVQGKRLYTMARKGISIERESRTVTIYNLEIVSVSGKEVDLRIACSKGTYIRTLCNDIGDKLGVGGCLSKLVRTQSGSFVLKNAYPLNTLSQMDHSQLEKILIPEDTLFPRNKSL